MDKQRIQHVLARRVGRVTAMLIVAFGLSACGQTNSWLKGKSFGNDDEPVILGAPDVGVYIEELGQLASNDAAAHAEIYADAAAAAQLTPGPSADLRLGLVLAIPGHPEADADRAQSLLREVLTQRELLTPAEVSLAGILLNSAERQSIAAAEVRNLRATTSRAQQTQEQAVSQRLALVEAENRRLRRELDDAEAKLNAITSIERSIREQE